MTQSLIIELFPMTDDQLVGVNCDFVENYGNFVMCYFNSYFTVNWKSMELNVFKIKSNFLTAKKAKVKIIKK